MLLMLNPTGMHPGITLEHLGLIPDILYEALLEVAKGEDLLTSLSGAYGFPVTPMKGKLVGTQYTYPRDEPLDPIAAFNNTFCSIYQYEYGIVAIRDLLTQTVTIVRMD